MDTKTEQTGRFQNVMDGAYPCACVYVCRTGIQRELEIDQRVRIGTGKNSELRTQT